jgi:hypothetical protein
MRAGASSEEKMGTVAFLAPMPMPRTKRTAKRACRRVSACQRLFEGPRHTCHEWVKPDAMGVAKRQRAVRKISPRRPR